MIYETHVKGFTMRHPDVREDLRGTYAGLASEPAIAYLHDLGVTAVELLPVHHISDESFLASEGLTNYWGYSTIGYLAPHSEYAATGRRGEQVREFKGMVKALHRAGIEVILDVVYNHTAEGNHLGPMLSFKGVDNPRYYRLMPDDPRHYMDFTGTGNSLNPVHPNVLRLIMDSLRYWVTECHVDGFRFDLASALAREFFDVDRLSAFFDVIHQDPVLSQVKLIAEPWDVGPGGYQVGNFPILWSEWNGVYRDTMRDFWRGFASAGEFAARLSGLRRPVRVRRPRPVRLDQLHHRPRRLHAARPRLLRRTSTTRPTSRTTTTAPMTTARGTAASRATTDDPEILALRARQQRNLLTTLLLSQGTPMLLGGDEFGRTQRGNNNAWCQDNEISWYDWSDEPWQKELREFTRRADRAAPGAPGLPPRRASCAARSQGLGPPDVWWFRADGSKMTRRDWRRGEHVLGDVPQRARRSRRPARGEAIEDDSFLVLFNAHHEDRGVHAPAPALRRAVGARAVDRRAPAEAGSPGTAPAPRSRWPALGRGPEARERERDSSAGELRATYRLQLTPDFGFADARALVPYLRDLGVTHLYLSPSLQARRGSTHGYDVVDPTALSRRARRRGGVAGLAGCAATPAWGSSSTSCRTTWRPTSKPLLGATRSYARGSSTSIPAPAGTGASSTSTSSRRSARRIRRSSRRRTSWCSHSSREGLVDGLRVDHPDGLADPAGYLRAAARAAACGASGWRRSSSATPARAAARLAGARDRRLRVPERRLRAVRRPGRRARR